MTIELTPVGMKCNLRCDYCYENPMRDAGNFGPAYDVDKMLEKVNGQFSLFGGEPLLTRIEDLEKIWKFGLEKYGANGLQTNGELITPQHLELFKKYRVHVGVSFDGPSECNAARSDDKGTQRTEDAIDSLIRERIPFSVIVTVHAYNSSRERLPSLLEWIRRRIAQGVTGIRLHFLENDGADHLVLPDDEHLEAWKQFYKLDREFPGIFDIFTDIRKGFNDEANRTCVWNGCDPYTTSAVYGINGQGHISNCGRINKEGVDWRKADTPGSERQLALYFTPQEFGGCKGCEYFSLCTGECPGTAIDGDWRNKTSHCNVLLGIFDLVKKEEGLEVKNRAAREKAIISGVNNERSHSDTPHQDSTFSLEHGDTTILGVAQIGRPASL